MADQTSSEELFALWQKQIQAGTEAWAKAAEQAQGFGQRPPAAPDPTMFWRPVLEQQMAAWAQMQGSGPVSPDVLALWKKFLDDWIETWSKALEQAMGTDAFAQMLGKTLDSFLNAQGVAKKAAAQASKASMETLGLPSRDQVTGISRQIMDLEDRIEWLEDKLVTLGETSERSGHNRHATPKKKARSKPKPGAPRATRKRRPAEKA